jgi:hypothetical protein
MTSDFFWMTTEGENREYENAIQLQRRDRRALYFHHKDVAPKWAAEYLRTVKIGKHVSYKPATVSQNSQSECLLLARCAILSIQIVIFNKCIISDGPDLRNLSHSFRINFYFICIIKLLASAEEHTGAGTLIAMPVESVRSAPPASTGWKNENVFEL